jgi:aminopeptidase C
MEESLKLMGELMASPARQAAQNVVTRMAPTEVLVNRARSSSYNHTYAVTVPKENKATDQKASG